MGIAEALHPQATGEDAAADPSQTWAQLFFLAEIGGSKLLEMGLDGRASPVGLGFLELPISQTVEKHAYVSFPYRGVCQTRGIFGDTHGKLRSPCMDSIRINLQSSHVTGKTLGDTPSPQPQTTHVPNPGPNPKPEASRSCPRIHTETTRCAQQR